MQKQDKKSYYAIISADVRYDSSLAPAAKLLFGEITALCNEKGFCWASNSYFAKLYNKDIQTISRWVQQLIDGRHITSEIDKAAGNKRRLYLSAKMPIGIGKKVDTLSTKKRIAIDKNAEQNNKDNTTSKTTDNKNFSEPDLSSAKGRSKYGFTLLVRFGVDGQVAVSLVYKQHIPLESIENAIKNGLAKQHYSQKRGTQFVLGPGYIINALNRARGEGKLVALSAQARKLSLKINDGRRTATI